MLETGHQSDYDYVPGQNAWFYLMVVYTFFHTLHIRYFTGYWRLSF